MKEKESQPAMESASSSGTWARALARRLFLGRLAIGAGVIGAAVGSSTVMAPNVAAADDSWKPARHAQDDWYDQIPGQHRFLLDTTSAEGMGWGLRFSGNYFNANQNAYGLQQSDLAVIIVARHKSTSFGYNNTLWTKYGKYFSEHAEFVDPKTKEAPKVNFYLSADDTSGQMTSIDDMVKKGAHFAVCAMSSRAIAGRIANGTGGNVDTIFKEIGGNLVSNARLVPAGIVAVSRAQEHGYTLATAV